MELQILVVKNISLNSLLKKRMRPFVRNHQTVRSKMQTSEGGALKDQRIEVRALLGEID